MPLNKSKPLYCIISAHTCHFKSGVDSKQLYWEIYDMAKVALWLSVLVILTLMVYLPVTLTGPTPARVSANLCKFVISEVRMDPLTPSTKDVDDKDFIEI